MKKVGGRNLGKFERHKKGKKVQEGDGRRLA